MICECAHPGCVCDNRDLNEDLVCGYCEVGVHWSAIEEAQYQACRSTSHRIECNDCEPVGYLELVYSNPGNEEPPLAKTRTQWTLPPRPAS